MNQQKTGEFLRRLRREKGLTQEQLAERFYVSSRTVSRWETGSNLPDVGTLIELADFYDVDIREIIDGERKGENMDKETKDTLKKVAAYAVEQERERKPAGLYFAYGVSILVLLFAVLIVCETNPNVAGFLPMLRTVLIVGMLLCGAFAVLYVWVSSFRENQTNAPERTVRAAVVSKEVKPGTHGAGRSMMGYSFMVTFRTEDGQTIEVYAYEVEYGGLKEGMTGQLTYKGRYFVDFEENA